MKEWEHLQSETQLAYEWFCRYRDMGAERSMAKLVQNYTRKKSYKSQLQVWSKKYNWNKRVMMYDSYLNTQKLVELENEILKAAREHILLADKIMKILLVKLESLENIEFSPMQWKALAEFAIKTKRDASGIAERFDVLGDADVRHKVSQRMVEEIREINKRLLAIRDGTADSLDLIR